MWERLLGATDITNQQILIKPHEKNVVLQESLRQLKIDLERELHLSSTIPITPISSFDRWADSEEALVHNICVAFRKGQCNERRGIRTMGMSEAHFPGHEHQQIMELHSLLSVNKLRPIAPITLGTTKSVQCKYASRISQVNSRLGPPYS